MYVYQTVVSAALSPPSSPSFSAPILFVEFCSPPDSAHCLFRPIDVWLPMLSHPRDCFGQEGRAHVMLMFFDYGLACFVCVPIWSGACGETCELSSSHLLVLDSRPLFRYGGVAGWCLGASDLIPGIGSRLDTSVSSRRNGSSVCVGAP